MRTTNSPSASPPFGKMWSIATKGRHSLEKVPTVQSLVVEGRDEGDVKLYHAEDGNKDDDGNDDILRVGVMVGIGTGYGVIAACGVPL